MYHMKRNGAEVPNERAASNPSPQFSVEYLEGPQSEGMLRTVT